MTEEPTSETRSSLNAEDWARAALDMVAEQGADAVAVEPLARSLGVTKGSFYWHFPNREALLIAAQELWEKTETEDVLARAAKEPDPKVRIKRAFAGARADRRASRMYLAWAQAGASDPVIDRGVRRVSERRLAFLIESYMLLGLDEKAARDWAILAYSVFLGILHVRGDMPEVLPEGPDYQAYVGFLNDRLIPDMPTTPNARIA